MILALTLTSTRHLNARYGTVWEEVDGKTRLVKLLLSDNNLQNELPGGILSTEYENSNLRSYVTEQLIEQDLTYKFYIPGPYQR